MFEWLKRTYANLGMEINWRRTLSLRVVVAGCFIGHGILAYQASTNFGSEWSAWVRSLFPREYEYQSSEIFLKTIALMDITNGLLLFLPRIPRIALAWVFCWGAMTAASRLYFLYGYSPPMEINTFNALAEFLKRAPNWITPLFLVAASSPAIEKRHQILSRKIPWLNFAILCQLSGILLHNAHEANGPFFDFELLKLGMPLWFFYVVTVGSALGILVVARVHIQPKIPGSCWFLPMIVTLTYICAEGFSIYSQNLPAGSSFTAVQFLSHFAQYYCMWMWSKIQLQITPPSVAFLRKATS